MHEAFAGGGRLSLVAVVARNCAARHDHGLVEAGQQVALRSFCLFALCVEGWLVHVNVDLVRDATDS